MSPLNERRLDVLPFALAAVFYALARDDYQIATFLLVCGLMALIVRGVD